MSLRAGLRVGLLTLALCSAACASSQRSAASTTPAPPSAPAPSAAMMPSEALGLWQSSFGAVKIEADPDSGQEHVMGVWLYERAGQEVMGFFAGELRGNVLELSWHEPSQPEDLTGAGYLVFEPARGQFAGEWWTHDQTRSGEWNGWRPAAQETAAPAAGGGQDGAGAASQADLGSRVY